MITEAPLKIRLPSVSNLALFNELDAHMKFIKCRCVDSNNIPCLYNDFIYDPVGLLVRNHINESYKYLRVDFTENPLELLLTKLGYSDENMWLLSSVQSIHDNIPVYYWRRHLAELRKEIK